MKSLLFISFLSFSTISFAQTACNFKGSQTLKAFLKPVKRTAPLIMAHQGGTEDGLPGNSMATFKRTVEKVPCVLLEFDIRMTLDSVLVVSHDNELELRTNGKGLLNRQKWSEVKKLNLKDNQGSITESHIPSFLEVLGWSKTKNLVLIVDKKPGTDIKKSISLLRKTGNLGKSVLICYSIQEAKMAHELAPDLMLAVGFNNNELIENVGKSGLPLDNLVALTPSKLQDESFYDKIHGMNVVASLGTNGNVDTLETSVSKPMYQKIWKTGADIICTDNPIFVKSLF